MNLSLNENIKLISYEKGQLIFKDGEMATSFFILIDGEVCTFKVNNNRIIPIMNIKKNDCIAEDSISSGRYNYNATALTKCEMARVDISDVNIFLNSSPDWIKNVLSEISFKLENTLNLIKEHQIIDNNLFINSFDTDIESMLLKSLKA